MRFSKNKSLNKLPLFLVALVALFVLFELFHLRNSNTTHSDVDASMTSALQAVTKRKTKKMKKKFQTTN